MLQIIKYPNPEDWLALLKRPAMEVDAIESRILPVLAAVKSNGDSALRAYTEQFDGVVINQLKVTGAEIEEAISLVDEELKSALNIARINIEKFHLAQREPGKRIETMPGVNCWRKSVPISKVGFYIPGGTAPLFSTIMMLGVPANVAGCEEIILCTPPNKEGKIHPAILYTAHFLGIKKIFKVGGAQAIAAMAYGTETIPSVYKIYGPGNQYVTAAKQLVNKQGTAIDMPAGPSEVLVIGDHTCNPKFVAADLLSQAEHGVDSQVIFVCTDKEKLNKVSQEVMLQAEALERKEFVLQALKNSKSILVHTVAEAIAISNAYAPEHLILQIENPDHWMSEIVNAGSVFLGHYTPESAGDYASGTNHTLPTNGFARAYSGVSLDSFVKKITFQHITPEGLANVGPVVETLAYYEGLTAHKNAVTLRLRKIANS